MPAYSINFNIIIIPKVISYNLYFTRRAKLGQIQGGRRAKLGQIQGGGLQRASQDSTKGGGVAIIFYFYALKISLFRVFTLSD